MREHALSIAPLCPEYASPPDPRARRYPNLWARIWANVRPHPPPAWTGLETACWLWQGALNARGYGRIQIRRPIYDPEGNLLGTKPRGVLVHRLVLYLVGYAPHEVPVASHLCGVKPCCNPEHLEPVTADENRLRYWLIELPARRNIGEICPESAPLAEREPGCDDGY